MSTYSESAQCRECSGTGKTLILQNTCTGCGGSGTVQITVP